MKKSLVIHPFLLALFSILFLFSHNIEKVSIPEIILPLAIVIFLTFFLWLFLGLLLKDYQRAGLFVSLYLLLFFSYGNFFYYFNNLTLFGVLIGRHRYFLLGWGILFLMGSYFITKKRGSLNNLTSVANIIAVSLIAMSLLNVISYKVREKAAFHHDGRTEMRETRLVILKRPQILPDIYYIILDGYANSSTLEEFFNYDNQEFIENLRRKGFYVASESRSNYIDSIVSLPSSLNMLFVHRTGMESWKSFGDMLENNRVIQALQRIGFRYIHFASPWEPTRSNRHANIIYRTSLVDREFNMLVLESTPLRPFFFFLLGQRKRDRILSTFERLADIPDMKGPIFTFAHLLTPHPPYVFGRKGEKITRALLSTEWEPKERYLDELIFLNKKLTVLVEQLLSKSKNPPIIILQGDHGPWFSDSSFKHKSGILNAYYFPGDGKDALYRSITPVNSFRVIFNHYFNTNLALLPDETYASDFNVDRYTFFDVTDQVRDD